MLSTTPLQNTTNKRKGATNAAGQPIRASRMDKPLLLDALISHFQSAPYWSLKSLNEHVKQPQMYLRECLLEIATLIPKGPYANMWTLKPEFKGSANAAVSAGSAGGARASERPESKPEVPPAAGAGVKEEEGVDDGSTGQGAAEDADDADLEMVS